MGWQQTVRLALAVIGAVGALILDFAPLATLGKIGTAIGIAALLGVVVLLEWDLHATKQSQPVPEGHRKDLQMIAAAYRLHLRGLTFPPEFLANESRNRAMIRAHYGWLEKGLERLAEAQHEAVIAQERLDGRAETAEDSLALGGSEGVVAELIRHLASIYATGGPETAHRIGWGWDIRPDGSIHMNFSGQDRLVAAAGRGATAQRLTEAMLSTLEWPETAKWRDARVREQKAADKLAARLLHITETEVIFGLGLCHWCGAKP